MIDNLSPISRRLIALALLILAVVSMLNLIILPTFGVARDRLEALQTARNRLSRLQALSAQPELPSGATVPPSLYLSAPSRPLAAQAMIVQISAQAARDGVSVEHISSLPTAASASQTLNLEIALSGPELAVVGMIGELEHGEPAIRISPWQLVASESAGGALRFTGRLHVAWNMR